MSIGPAYLAARRAAAAAAIAHDLDAAMQARIQRAILQRAMFAGIASITGESIDRILQQVLRAPGKGAA
jgi:hypothetical protein